MVMAVIGTKRQKTMSASMSLWGGQGDSDVLNQTDNRVKHDVDLPFEQVVERGSELPANYRTERNRAEVTAVERIVPIVAHHEEMVWGDGNRCIRRWIRR